MTRKITLSIILIVLIVVCYNIIFGDSWFATANVSELQAESKKLNTAIAQLEKSRTTEFEAKKKELAETIKEYQEAKEEYESYIPEVDSNTSDSMVLAEENQLKDIYDVDFLWTILGNYATEEGINLKFDVTKNTTSASAINNKSNSYVVCDLKFTITGNYINLTDFIYDIEDDDRLSFEINDFDMVKSGDGLEVTLVVRAIKINANNLIETSTSLVDETEISTDEDETETSDTKLPNAKEQSQESVNELEESSQMIDSTTKKNSN